MTDIRLDRITEDGCKNIWLWRNHPEVRKNFFNTEPVSWQEHKRWFASKIKDSHIKIYIAMLGEDKIGVIRFESESNFAKVSINLNPDFFGRGFGSKIIQLGTEKFLNESIGVKPIIAEIKKDNIASQKAFEKAGYECTEVTGKKLVYEKRY